MIAAILAFWAAQETPQRLLHRDGIVEISRDAHGVPHIRAPTPRALFWGQGYAHAQDRLWQMDLLRRSARGRMAELFGDAHLPADLRRVQAGYAEAELQEMLNSASGRFREAARQFAEGVNAFLDQYQGRWAPQYAQQGIEPTAWRAVDVVAVAVVAARRFGEWGAIEVECTRLHRFLTNLHSEETARQVLDDIFHLDDPAAPTMMGDETPPAPAQGRATRLATDVPEALLAAAVAAQEAAAADLVAAGWPSYSGSNAWVVSPTRARGGRALLYAGPMMGLEAPSIAYEVRLSCPEFDAAGMALPALPGLLIGFTRHVAWAFTSSRADMVDVYALELNPDNPDQYRRNGAWRSFERVAADFPVRFQSTQTVDCLRWPGGAVVQLDAQRHRALAEWRPYWKEEHRTIGAFLDLLWARTLADVRQAVDGILTGHNILCATADGHIAYWFTGRHPIRRHGHDPRFVQPGDGTMDWLGVRPFDELPSLVDPPRGLIANWNTKPCRDWKPFPAGRVFCGRVMAEQLAARPTLSLEDCLEVARLCCDESPWAAYYLPPLLEILRGSSRRAHRRVAQWLASWDGKASADSPAPLVFREWIAQLSLRAFRPALGPLVHGSAADLYWTTPILDLLLGERSPRPLQYDYLQGEPLDKFVLQALDQALDRIRAEHGSDESRWRLRVTLRYPDPVGEVATLPGRPTYALAVELADPPRALSILPPGQSADPGSPHFGDQLELFREWRYKSIRLGSSEAAQ